MLNFTQILWRLVCFVPTWLARCWGSTGCGPACSQPLTGRRLYWWGIFWALSRAAWWCSPHWGQGWCSCQLWVWWAWSCGLLQTSQPEWGWREMQADPAENFLVVEQLYTHPCVFFCLLSVCLMSPVLCVPCLELLQRLGWRQAVISCTVEFKQMTE